MSLPSVAILHYSAPPVVGGVEMVIEAHARLLCEHGYPVTVIAGEGEQNALPPGVELVLIPELSTQNARIQAASTALEEGLVPSDFERLVDELVAALDPLLRRFDLLVAHNVFTKHFNLPLTLALSRLLDRDAVRRGWAWCHDFTWTSPGSRDKVRPGYPWDLLRAYQPELEYITVSAARQKELAGLLGVEPAKVRIVYNGVDLAALLGLSARGQWLAAQMGLLDSGLVALMPVRITRAKNIEFALRVAAALKAEAVEQLRFVLTGPPDPHSPNSLEYYQTLLELRRVLGLEDEFRFVYELDGEETPGRILSPAGVGELYRLADVVFLPSLREGFGMPVVEAGLAGVPTVSSERVPAANELSGEDGLVFSLDTRPEALARQMIDWLSGIPTVRLKRRVRRDLTWEAIFRKQIQPLIDRGRPV